MNCARNVVGMVAVATLVSWLVTATFRDISMNVGKLGIQIARSGVAIAWGYEFPAVWPPKFFPGEPWGPWMALPEWADTGISNVVRVPHWLTNLIAWSLFILLWRKARKHPKGCCQTCGYSLKGNESGKCSECGALKHE